MKSGDPSEDNLITMSPYFRFLTSTTLQVAPWVIDSKHILTHFTLQLKYLQWLLLLTKHILDVSGWHKLVPT